MTSSKNKILLWAVILLMIANVAVLSTLWVLHHKEEDSHKGSPADYLIKELSLNTDQQKQLHQLADQHHQQADEIREKIKDAKDSFFSLLNKPTITDSIKKYYADNAANNVEQLDLLTFDHFQQVRKICTPQQQKKFDEIIRSVLQMMAPPPGNRPPPPHY